MKTILKNSFIFVTFFAVITVSASQYVETDLTGYTTGQNTRYTDPNLNGWCMVRLPNGIYAVADTCPGVVTFYAPDFSNNRFDMFDRHFSHIGSFIDPNISSQYPGNTAFQVENEDGKLFVTFGGFAPPFGGVVDVFDYSGNLLTPGHFAANLPG